MTAALTSRLVGELVAERPARARLFEHLGIDYCCGGRRPLADACREHGVDAATVAVLLDALDEATDRPAEPDWARASLLALCDHIVEVHHAYLRRELPRLSELLAKCVRAHAADRPELIELRATFERLRAELERHLAEEERVLFPVCRTLEPGEPADSVLPGSLERLETEHAATGGLLERLSLLTGGYDLGGALCNTHRAALDALAALERDLHEHVHEENNILFPRVLANSAL
jgi:regulator of cell morphogenesis and NO signaling